MVTNNATDYFNQRADQGYGLMFPDGHIIRAWEHLLKHKITKDNPKLLDFGCWNGTHAKYFQSKGFDSYGVDIVDKPIADIKHVNGLNPDNFSVINNETNLDELFDKKFDLILSNQVLYYLDDTVLKKRLNEFKSMLSNDGFVVFTMMAKSNFFSNYSNNSPVNGLEEINFPKDHRLHGQVEELRFIDSYEHLKETFDMFETVTCGCYDITYNEKESALHYIFVGR